MKITTVRRISQTVFFALFLWFCVVATVGDKFHQIRNWPINLFLWLDPLTGLGTLISSHILWAPLVFSLVTISVTIILGRIFCGWVCPFGTIHHFFGFLGQKLRDNKKRAAKGRYGKYHSVKYLILFVFIGLTAGGFGYSLLQTGLLSPIPLVTRSFSIMLLPIFDSLTKVSMATARHYEGGFVILAVFFILVGLNLFIPRFFCRFLCPSGALLGIFARFRLFDFVRDKKICTACCDCTAGCTGGCDPQGRLKSSECVMCFNCRQVCPEEAIVYSPRVEKEHSYTKPDISRRGFALSLAGGVMGVKALALADSMGENYNNMLIRPPGALPEEEFQKRCIKCGQCMRVCPTNVLQPAGINLGLVNMWTPTLNNRIGSSGCQINCTACSQVCPTAAIKPITLDEKHGTGEFADNGPVKIGTAFVDRNRCLPWAMGKPCIVCEENCPVSPKAIRTLDIYEPLEKADIHISGLDSSHITAALWPDLNIATGDYYVAAGGHRYKIAERNGNVIRLDTPLAKADKTAVEASNSVSLVVRLQRPMVDITRCIGCGTCEHECPVSGLRAIRISAEGETRNRSNRLLLE